MKFLIDANLPFKLALLLENKGYNVIHTDNLKNKEQTTDNEIRKIASEENYIVVTKDSDFFDSHLINKVPPKLLFVTTGNIINSDLLHLFDLHFEKVITLFEKYDCVELDNKQIIVHEK
jgi:predicted nuclease of predicted toxin-antitoxin system